MAEFVPNEALAFQKQGGGRGKYSQVDGDVPNCSFKACDVPVENVVKVCEDALQDWKRREQELLRVVSVTESVMERMLGKAEVRSKDALPTASVREALERHRDAVAEYEAFAKLKP